MDFSYKDRGIETTSTLISLKYYDVRYWDFNQKLLSMTVKADSEEEAQNKFCVFMKETGQNFLQLRKVDYRRVLV